MGTILKFLPDTSFLNNIFVYLETCHGIRTMIVDKDGTIDPLAAQVPAEYPHTNTYPISFHENIGGIRCSAESQDALAAADPHIKICIAGIENLLEKDIVVRQTMDEILHLSDYLHFLFGLAGKLSGVHDVQQYGTMVLQEIAREISADSAFAHINDPKDDNRIIHQNLSVEDVKSIEQDPEKPTRLLIETPHCSWDEPERLQPSDKNLVQSS